MTVCTQEYRLEHTIAAQNLNTTVSLTLSLPLSPRILPLSFATADRVAYALRAGFSQFGGQRERGCEEREGEREVRRERY